MRALVQRVTRARVTVDGCVIGEIGAGLLILVGATDTDDAAAADWLARKTAGLRLFADSAGRLNLDLGQVRGGALVVPQFTLYGDARHGRRPDFTRAAPAEQARGLFERFCGTLAAEGVPVERGAFREHMQVELVNDGPVTLCLESPAGATGDG
ncbi:MAG TPA: D-aminoacyl-tRNA deacylase [Candidatus Eisenbacteria bacterium]|jgi:D-tyrosyl-tRNA(Tyr) deacylase